MVHWCSGSIHNIHNGRCLPGAMAQQVMLAEAGILNGRLYWIGYKIVFAKK